MELNFREYVEHTSFRIEGLTVTEQMEFEYYLQELYGEGFGDFLRKGWEGLKTGAKEFGKQFKTAYGKAKDPEHAPEIEKKVVEMAKKAYPAAQHYSQKLGIPISLVLALVVSGAIGGPAAVPLTLVTYLVRKPLLKLAGKGFDIGAEALGVGPKKPGEEPVPAEVVPEPRMVQGKYGRTLMPTGTSAYGVAEALLYEAALYNLYDEAFGDWMKKIGGMAGKGIGAAVGTGRRYVGALANIVKTNVGAMIKFARKNPVTVVKGLFLIAVGAAIGYGVRSLIQQSTQAISAVAEGAGNAAPAGEIEEVASQVGVEGAGAGADVASTIEIGGGQSIPVEAGQSPIEALTQYKQTLADLGQPVPPGIDQAIAYQQNLTGMGGAAAGQAILDQPPVPGGSTGLSPQAAGEMGLSPATQQAIANAQGMSDFQMQKMGIDPLMDPLHPAHGGSLGNYMKWSRGR